MLFKLLWLVLPENVTPLCFSLYELEVDAERNIQTVVETYQVIRIKILSIGLYSWYLKIRKG